MGEKCSRGRGLAAARGNGGRLTQPQDLLNSIIAGSASVLEVRLFG
jgi:hypothetical protein